MWRLLRRSAGHAQQWVSVLSELSCSERLNKCSAVAEMGDRLATIDTGWKLGGGLCPFWGELGPHLTQCGLGWGLPSYQVASWSIQLFADNRHGPKIWGRAVPRTFGGAGLHLTHCCLGWGLPPVPTKWHLDPSSHLFTTDMSRKWGEGLYPF